VVFEHRTTAKVFSLKKERKKISVMTHDVSWALLYDLIIRKCNMK